MERFIGIRMLENLYGRLRSKLYRCLIPVKARLVRRKRKIKVVFILSHISMWKNDSLYQAMVRNARFDPIIILVPDLMLHDPDNDNLQQAESYLVKKGYTFLTPFKGKALDPQIALKRLHADIIFYSRPYNAYPIGFRYEDNYNSLFCYSNYGYHMVKDAFIADTRFVNHLWQNYYENDFLKVELLTLYPHLRNSVKVTGLPNTDLLVQSSKGTPQKGDKQYRIIWAPHFSVGENWLNYSNFLTLADELLNYVKNTDLPINIVFKPHPLLKEALYNHSSWGKSKTDHYYEAWNQIEKGDVAEGDYIDLFLSSDAMIHDCSSFSVEYLHMNKPVMFLYKDKQYTNDNLWNAALEALSCHYSGNNIDDIKNFIQDIVVQGNDIMKSARMAYFNKYLLPPNNMSAAQNIIDSILYDAN